MLGTQGNRVATGLFEESLMQLDCRYQALNLMAMPGPANRAGRRSNAAP
jgi:hypothetical protein